eukprot:Phypoly_transcript_18744.p1 GENE.Phypoly_transcript_18744~~Phypoly_transcript_18744.p1  ORF type:complete len:229 (+),score=12.92 Phypoly_transcript_18744:66-689(+)
MALENIKKASTAHKSVLALFGVLLVLLVVLCVLGVRLFPPHSISQHAQHGIQQYENIIQVYQQTQIFCFTGLLLVLGVFINMGIIGIANSHRGLYLIGMGALWTIILVMLLGAYLPLKHSGMITQGCKNATESCYSCNPSYSPDTCTSNANTLGFSCFYYLDDFESLCHHMYADFKSTTYLMIVYGVLTILTFAVAIMGANDFDPYS